jgi:selenobiotic family peptide radical SAM maturase
MTIFPTTRTLMGQAAWEHAIGTEQNDLTPENVPGLLTSVVGPNHPPWLPALAQLELLCHRSRQAIIPDQEQRSCLCLNPSLELATLDWHNLPPLLTAPDEERLKQVTAGEELVLTWRDPSHNTLHCEAARPEQLLAIKLVAEEISPEQAARTAGVSVTIIDDLLRTAIDSGILLSPPSGLRRPTDRAAAEVFTLQWHLTQSCDLACKHCYDRSQRADFPFDRAVSLMQELRDFCRQRFVRPQVTLTGGNPLLHPRFFELYQAAADHGLMIAILGNASDRATLERMMAIQPPVYYQVSLEGLEQHNDQIRGSGNYRRTVAFLKLLTELGIPNLVMLTLTKANLNQVLPLGRELAGITGGLTFNRLALFGEGAKLALPSIEEYQDFLNDYVAALPEITVLALKDSLLNCVFEQQERPLFGGCAGFGCGAAFNFLSILSDGEVHACRKLPSPLGNIREQSLETIYGSELATRYRSGSTACIGCDLRPVCGGCMAVTASFGLDPFSNKDPYCTRKQ